MPHCDCAGRLHVVCRVWRVDERPDPCVVSATVAADAYWHAYSAAHVATVPPYDPA